MSRTAERLARLLSMVPWVIEHPGAPLDEVCERFGYRRDELVADLNLVFVCGLPGYGPGDLIDVYLDEREVTIEMADYFARPLRLEAGEALGLVAAGTMLMATGQASPALERAVDKLTSALGVTDELAIEVAAEPELVGVLRQAAEEHHPVEIVYTAVGDGSTTTRIVEPWLVFTTLGNWYVTGFCRLAGARRVFRVDRIRTATPLRERFEPPAEPPEPDVTYVASPEDAVAVIELDPPAYWVAEYYPVEIVEQRDDLMRVRFFASDPSIIARLMLRLGTHGRIVEGDEAQAATDDLRRRILARYGVTISQ